MGEKDHFPKNVYTNKLRAYLDINITEKLIVGLQ